MFGHLVVPLCVCACLRACVRVCEREGGIEREEGESFTDLLTEQFGEDVAVFTHRLNATAAASADPSDGLAPYNCRVCSFPRLRTEWDCCC